MATFRLRDTATGETFERNSLDAREIVAQGNGRYVLTDHNEPAPGRAPNADVPPRTEATASVPAQPKKKRDNSKAIAAMQAANARRRAAKAQSQPQQSAE